MKHFLVLLTAIAGLWCGPAVGAEKLKIVTTTCDLAAIAEAVAGEKAEVHSICTGKEDPHVLQAKPSVMLQARDADLWIRVGLDLEIGWEPPILDGSRNARIRPGRPGHLDASESAMVLEVPETPITRAMGDVHPQGNPHFWLDPLNGRRLARGIAVRLAELAPADADFFRANADAFQAALDERMFGPALVAEFGAEALWAKMEDDSLNAFLKDDANRGKAGGWSADMLPLHGQAIVTYHKSWIYFANRFGLDVADQLEPKPGIPPTAAHLEKVASTAKAQGVTIILQEPYYSTKAADRIAAQTGARVVVVANSVGGQPEAADYLSLMDLIVSRVSGVNAGVAP